MEVWSEKMIDYSNFKVFDTLPFAHIKHDKLDARDVKCVFIEVEVPTSKIRDEEEVKDVASSSNEDNQQWLQTISINLIFFNIK